MVMAISSPPDERVARMRLMGMMPMRIATTGIGALMPMGPPSGSIRVGKKGRPAMAKKQELLIRQAG
jgi:hypothetical protein